MDQFKWQIQTNNYIKNSNEYKIPANEVSILNSYLNYSKLANLFCITIFGILSHRSIILKRIVYPFKIKSYKILSNAYILKMNIFYFYSMISLNYVFQVYIQEKTIDLIKNYDPEIIIHKIRLYNI